MPKSARTARALFSKAPTRVLSQRLSDRGEPIRVRVPVTARALFQRINRKLAAHEQKLKRSRRIHGNEVIHFDPNVGEYYVVNVEQGWLVEKDVDIEDLGRKCGALANWEALAR